MKKHIFPLHLEPFARAIGDPDDEYIPWPKGEHAGCDDVWIEWSDLTMLLGAGTVIYTSLKMSEEMVQYVSKIGKAMRSVAIVGVIEHGSHKFAPYVLQGALRFAKEEGATVDVVLSKEHADKLSYYRDALEFERCGLTPRIVDASVQRADGRKEEATEKIVPKVEPSSVQAQTQTSDPFFVEKRGGGLVERDVRGVFISDWENSSPHGEIGAHFGGIPLFMNPGDILVLANLIEHVRPSLVVEMNAYKYGLTSVLLRLTSPYGSKVIAQNQPYIDGPDAPWKAKVRAQHGSDRLSFVYNYPEDAHEPYDVDGGVLFVVNYHQAKCLVGCARLFFGSVKKSGIIAFHAPNHMEAPRFLMDFRKRPGVSEVELRYNPIGGSWYKDGIFLFNKSEAKEHQGREP